MRTIVLDASVAVKWYVHEAGRDDAVRLLSDSELSFVAPDVFLGEVVNALLRQNREASFSAELLNMALLDLAATSPQLISTSVVVTRAAALAVFRRHPIYDCLYLALAEIRDTVFVTADRRFLKLCRAKLADDVIVERLRSLEEFAAA